MRIVRNKKGAKTGKSNNEIKKIDILTKICMAVLPFLLHDVPQFDFLKDQWRPVALLTRSPVTKIQKQ